MSSPDVPLKLNLGCGADLTPGFVNVDKYGSPDVRCDLEKFPWPWPDNSVGEVRLFHVLEHLGQKPDDFTGILKELYRVCRDGATIFVRVPHPRHDTFLDDPTHVRAVTPATFALFSMKANRHFIEHKNANSLLAMQHNVDFDVTGWDMLLDQPYRGKVEQGTMTRQEAMDASKTFNNVVIEFRIMLTVRKTPGNLEPQMNADKRG